jgi:hypothetical protein
MDVLERTLSYDEVTEIFVRVNSLGAKLRSSDLALAQITAKWKHSLQTFLDFRSQCANQGFELDLGLHLKNLMVFATGQSRFKTVGSLSLGELQKAWKESGEGMSFALNFLKSNVGIDSPALLASPFLIIVLAYFGHIRGYLLSSEEAAQLRYWVLTANAQGRFSRGSSESILDRDLSTLKKGGGVQDLIDRLRSQVGRLDITADELEGRGNAREAYDIANLAFIGGKTNRAISDKAPAMYLPPLLEQHPQSFTAQAIPTSAEMLGLENYKAFLVARRHMIAERLNLFLLA